MHPRHDAHEIFHDGALLRGVCEPVDISATRVPREERRPQIRIPTVNLCDGDICFRERLRDAGFSFEAARIDAAVISLQAEKTFEDRTVRPRDVHNPSFASRDVAMNMGDLAAAYFRNPFQHALRQVMVQLRHF